MVSQQFRWSSEYETGIDVIDKQHQRIFDYLVEVDHAIKENNTGAIQAVVHALIDYSISHNAFEETLMERGRYPVLDAHAQVHEAFKRRALSYDKRLRQGEEPVRVAGEVRSDIGLWLTNHIQRDDKDYIPFVRRAIEGSFVSRMVQRFF